MAAVVDCAVAPVRAPHRLLRLSWLEARPVVQVIFQLRFLSGALLTSRAGPFPLDDLLAGAAAWLCATWHVYLVNGLCDQTEDRCNRSTRPLATGALPIPAARAVATVLALAALGLGAAVSWRLAVLVALMLCLGAVYSAGPRPQKANVAGFVAVVTAGGLVTYLAGWVTVAERALPEPRLCLFAAVMSLWMSLAGMTKDLSDVTGDRAAGRRTLPILLGPRAARRVLAGIISGVVGLALVSTHLAARSLLPAAVILLVGGTLVIASLLVRWPQPHRQSPEHRIRTALRRPYHAFLLTQYGVHVAIIAQEVLTCR